MDGGSLNYLVIILTQLSYCNFGGNDQRIQVHVSEGWETFKNFNSLRPDI